MSVPKPEPDLARPYFQCEIAALERLEQARWPGGPVCPYCASTKHYDLQRTRLGLRKCSAKHCRKQFSVKSGTIFNRSHVPDHKLLQIVYMRWAFRGEVNVEYIRNTLDIEWKSAKRLYKLVGDGVIQFLKEKSGRDFSEQREDLRSSSSIERITILENHFFDYALRVLLKKR